MSRISRSIIFRSARSLEAIENFALAEFPLAEEEPGESQSQSTPWEFVYDDGHFWSATLNNPKAWGKTFQLNYCVLSEWVARIPGLFQYRSRRTVQRKR